MVRVHVQSVITTTKNDEDAHKSVVLEEIKMRYKIEILPPIEFGA